MRVSIEEAIQSIYTNCKRNEVVSLPISSCLHMVNAKDIYAPINQPPFNRSAVDGYAYKSNTSFKELKIKKDYYAGDNVDISLEENECISITTGGMLPDCVDVVTKFEDVEVKEHSIVLHQSLKQYTNYVPAGEDYSKGELLIPKNTQLDAIHLSILSSSGISFVDVYKPLKVKILATGSELNEENTPLQPGKIFNSTYIYLQSRLHDLYIDQIDFESIYDDFSTIESKIQEASLEYDVIFTSGGVSVGAKDYVVKTIRALNGTVHFHGVGMKPGMPTAFCSLNKADILCLSGNPFACFVAFEILFTEMISIYQNNPKLKLVELHVPILNEWHKPLKQPRYVRGIYKDNTVFLPEGHANGQILSMRDCNCLVRLDTEVNVNDLVKVYLL